MTTAPADRAQPTYHASLTPLLTSLYVAQGLPFGFFTLALPVVLREAGWSLTAINLLQVLGLPWVLKFLWAPWLDRALQQAPVRRLWLLRLQAMSCVLAALATVACAWWPMGLPALPHWLPLAGLFALVLTFNVLASTQDIVTDGLAVRALSARQRGWANGIQVGAYRLGMVLGGGGLLWLFAKTGWPHMLGVMALLLAALAVPVWQWRGVSLGQAPATDRPALLPHSDKRARWWGWWLRANTPGMRTALWLIVCYRFGDQMVSSLLTPFLRDQVADTSTVALMKGTVGSVASLVGALLGGWWVQQVPRRTALLWAGGSQVLAFVLYLVLALGHGGMPLLWAATVLEGLLGTVATVALFAWMMDAADPEHAGTDYTLMASAVVLVGSVAGLVGGLMGDAWGYAAPFAVGALLCAWGTWAMVVWQDRHPVHARLREAWH